MLKVDEKLFNLGLRVASAEIRGVSNGPASADLRRSIERRSNDFVGRTNQADIANLPAIAAYKNFYARLRISRSVVRPSIERMTGSLMKGKAMPSINAIVDAYNLMSVEHQMCMGAHDLRSLKMPIAVRLARGGEVFTPLGGRDETVKLGEYGYFCSTGIMICRDNAVQCSETPVGLDTRDVLLVVESLSYRSADEILRVTAETASFIQAVAGGVASEACLGSSYFD